MRMLPQVTLLALSLGHVLSGSILVELVFGYPGVGQQLFRAIQNLDYFVIYGIVLVLIWPSRIAMLVVDLVNPLLDPRLSGMGAALECVDSLQLPSVRSPAEPAGCAACCVRSAEPRFMLGLS